MYEADHLAGSLRYMQHGSGCMTAYVQGVLRSRSKNKPSRCLLSLLHQANVMGCIEGSYQLCACTTPRAALQAHELGRVAGP